MRKLGLLLAALSVASLPAYAQAQAQAQSPAPAATEAPAEATGKKVATKKVCKRVADVNSLVAKKVCRVVAVDDAKTSAQAAGEGGGSR